jgi:hypothetical protein
MKLQNQLPIPLHLREPLIALGSRLRQQLGARLQHLRLFGSAARYAASEDSDVDLAIVVPDLTDPERDLIVTTVAETAGIFDVPLSPFVVSSAHFETLLRRGRAIAHDIVREGIAA